MEVPALDDRPSLYPDLRLDYEAFIVLSSSRPVGMAVMAIPISEIKSYMDMFGISSLSERKLFLRRIKIMDGIYMDYINAQEKAKKKPKAKKR